MNEEFDFENRIVSSSMTTDDGDTEASLRPKDFSGYIGQEKVKENLKVYIEAAKRRGDTLDHLLADGSKRKALIQEAED